MKPLMLICLAFLFVSYPAVAQTECPGTGQTECAKKMAIHPVGSSDGIRWHVTFTNERPLRVGQGAAYVIEYYFLDEGDAYFVILENVEYQLLRDALDRFNEENIQQTPTYGWGTFSLEAESCLKKEKTAFYNRKEVILLFQRLDLVAEGFKPESKENVHGAFELLMHRL